MNTVQFAEVAYKMSQKQLVTAVVTGRRVQDVANSEFMMLVCQQLFLNPDADVVHFCATQPGFKYLTAFALVVMRFQQRLFDYEIFSNALKDPRKIIIGQTLSTIDQLAYRLLTEPSFGGAAFPWRIDPKKIRITK